MRDPDRIPDLCAVLERTWALYPDMRLGQLIVNAIRPSQPCPQVFYTEDEPLRRGLERLVEAKRDPGVLDERRFEAIELEWQPRSDERPSSVRLDRAREATFDLTLYGYEWGGREPLDTVATILELRFVGEYGHGSLGNPDAMAMRVATLPHLLEARPDVVVLDLSDLRYTWGNAISGLLETITEFDNEIPIEIVVLAGESSRALDGLLSVHFERERALREARRLAARRSAKIG